MVDVHERPRLLLIKTEREDGNRVRLSVRDAGMGLPPQGLDSLFDAFHTTKSGGMGIGLFVSRSILERHQGRLWAEPNDGPAPPSRFPFRQRLITSRVVEPDAIGAIPKSNGRSPPEWRILQRA